MIEWDAVRKAANRLLTVAGWKHRAPPFVEQERLPPMPEDRGAAQGDVDGHLECSLVLGMVAAEAPLHVAAPQSARTLNWIGINDLMEERRIQAQHENRKQQIRNLHLAQEFVRHLASG